MRAIPALLALLACSFAGASDAQVLAPPSSTYLFTTNVEDARSVWINPAGLAIVPEASIYAELVADRADASWGVKQYTFGLGSRGVAVSYQRDRFPTGSSAGRWRVGAGFPLARRMAVGSAVTFYGPGRGTDIGLRFSPLRPLDVAIVVREIGRPVVNGEALPLKGVAGINWLLGGGRVGLAAEAIAIERRPASGYDRTYRAGALLIVPARTPVSLLTTVELAGDLRLARWSFGVALGAQNQMIAIGSTLPDTSGPMRFESVNFAAIARGRTRR